MNDDEAIRGIDYHASEWRKPRGLWRRLNAWVKSSRVERAEVVAAVFAALGLLRLPAGAAEAQVLVLVGLVWAVLALVRAVGR